MKICPRCQKTYPGDDLNFCLEDGATLIRTKTAGDPAPATLKFDQPRANDPRYPLVAPPPNPNEQNFGSRNSAPPKKSKTWLWAVGIIGGLLLLCGGGFTGLVFYAARLENNNRNAKDDYSNNDYSNADARRTPTPLAKPGVKTIDLSKWADGSTDLGAAEYKNGELFLSSKKKNYYYVLAASVFYKTENAVTRVSVRNVGEEASMLGYGLVIHSNPVPLKQDYAFLIDSVNKKYRVVRHSPGKETAVVGWTRQAAIKDGGAANILEIRDADKKMNFYINGEFVKAFENTDGYDGGVAGIYSGDAVEIAFSNLEIEK